jgi:Holliday junction resolvase RusA-like endonuclease
MIQAVLPYPPSTNRLWRYSKQGRAYLTPEAAAWKIAAAWAIKAAILKGFSPVVGKFHLYLEAGRPDKRRRDIDNLFKITLDAVQLSGAVENDSEAEYVGGKWIADLKGIRVTITPASADPWISLGDAAVLALKKASRS